MEETVGIMTENETRELIRRRHEGFTGFCGVVIDEAEAGVCRAHVDLEARHLNPRGFAHGGLQGTLMDVAAGCAAITAGDPPRMMVTQSAQAHYLRPCSGGRLTATAKTVKAGRYVAVVQVELTDGEGRLVTTGSFELFYLQEPETT